MRASYVTGRDEGMKQLFLPAAGRNAEFVFLDKLLTTCDFVPRPDRADA